MLAPQHQWDTSGAPLGTPLEGSQCTPGRKSCSGNQCNGNRPRPTAGFLPRRAWQDKDVDKGRPAPRIIPTPSVPRLRAAATCGGRLETLRDCRSGSSHPWAGHSPRRSRRSRLRFRPQGFPALLSSRKLALHVVALPTCCRVWHPPELRPQGTLPPLLEENENCLRGQRRARKCQQRPEEARRGNLARFLSKNSRPVQQ